MSLRSVFLPLVFPLAALHFTLAFSQDTIRQHYEAAEAHKRARNLTAAEAEFAAILAEGYGRLGKIYLAQKAYEKAATALEAAALSRPAAPEALIDLAVAYFNAGQYEKASEPLRRALTRNPNSADARHMLGKTRFMRGEFAKAAAELETAVKLAPKDYDAAYTLGLAYLKQGQLAPAKQIYSRMLRQLGDRPQLRIVIGRAYRETVFLAEAIEEFKKAIALDPKSTRAHYYLGLTYLLKDGTSRFNDAAEEFKTVLALNPEDYFANYYLGIIHLKERRLEPSISLLEKASRLRLDNPDPYFFLGQAYQAMDKHDQAVEALRKSIALTASVSHNDYQVARAHYQLGQSLLKTGRMEEGEKELKLAAELKTEGLRKEEMKTTAYLNPASMGEQSDKLLQEISAVGVVAEPETTDEKAAGELKSGEDYYTKVVASAHNNVGILRAGREDFRGAAEQFALAAKWNPRLEEIHFNWGLACYKAELYQQAILPLETELKINPASLPAKQLLGSSYFMVDNSPKASELLTEVVSVKTNDAGLYYMLAISLIKQKKREEANQIVQRLATLHGSSPQLHILLGQIYYDQGETAKALEELKAALALDNKTRLAHFYSGLVYVNLGKFDEAARAFESELAINPNDIQAKYHLGFVLLADQQIDRGIRLMREIIRLRPDYAEAHYELGKTLLLQGSIKEAVERLETAVKLKPDAAYAHYQLGRAYLAAGRKAEGASQIEISNRLKAKERDQPNQ
jgi:tetratricopeptide (TPR) repeat protein